MFENTVKKAADTIHRVAVATVNEYGFYADLVDSLADALETLTAGESGEFIRGAEFALHYVESYARGETKLIREG